MNNFNSKSPFDFYRNRFTIIGIAISGLLGLMNTNAQNPNTIFKNTTQTGNAPNIACKSVRLAAGYKYTAQPGYSMQASVNPYLGCDVDYGTGYSPLTIPPLNTSYEVGTTPGSFDVSQSGAATYSITLMAPPGTMGMAPKLSINYNSQGGNGLMGIGWSLGGFGLSAITRTSQNYYFEGQTSPVSLNSNDRFLLDGSRLMPTSTGTYGAIGMTYGTESETFVKVTSMGGAAGNPAWFKVETKEGYTLEYGNTTNSFINAGATTIALTWLLNKVTDVNGNYMTITYFENNGEFYPDRIDYTGNTSPALTPYNYIKFVYDGNRTDKQIVYIAGYPVKQNVLLTAVEMWAQGTKVHEYNFKYSDASLKGAHAESRLSEVIEFGTDGKQFNSTKIVWDISSDNSILSYTSNKVSLGNIPATDFANTPYTGDFNGDGFTDYCIIPKVTTANPMPTTAYLYLNNGYGVYPTTPINFTIPAGYYKTVNIGSDSHEAVADINADGMDDIIFRSVLSNTNYYSALIATGSGFSTPYSAFPPAANVYGDPAYELIGDFTGDGNSDLFVYYYDKDRWFIHDFTLNTTYNSTVDWGSASLSFNTVDIDGDGKHEIMFTYNNPNSQPDGINDYNYVLGLDMNTRLLYTVSHGGFPNSCQGKYRTIYTGDFNGDGKTDFLGYTYCSNGWNIGYAVAGSSPGTAIQYQVFSAPIGSNFNSTFYNDHQYEYYVADFDGDGKSDISVINHYTNYLTIYYSIGNNNFVQSGFYVNQTWSPTTGLIGDFNGDGHSDIMHSGYLAAKYGVYFLNTNNGSPATYNDYNKVTSVTNGFNATTTIDYNTLPELSLKSSTIPRFNVYKLGSTTGLPNDVIKFQKAIPVASRVLSDNGIGSRNETKYAYYGALMHTKGKGFLGFDSTSVTNITSKIQLINAFGFDALNLKQLLLTKSKTLLMDINTGNIVNIINSKLLQYNQNWLNNFRYYFYVKRVDGNNLIDGTSSISTFTQDSYGNTTNSTSINGPISIVTNNLYQQKGTWIPSSLLHSDKTTTRTGQQANRIWIDYINDNFGRPTKITTIADFPGLGSPGSSTVVNDLTYGNFGTPLSSSISSSYPTVIPARLSTDVYDPLGRFVIQQKNSLNQIVLRSYDNAYGNILTETDPNSLISQFTYDSFGRIKQTTTPNGQQINIVRAWSGGSGPSNSLFQVTTTQQNAPSSNEYCDLLGRTLRKQTTGFDGTNINTDFVYNSLGQLVSQSEPYFQGGTLLNNTFTYDEYSRQKISTSALGAVVTTNYTFGSTTINITNTGPGQKNVTKTFDASGALTSVTDAGGTLTYTYNSIGKPLTISIPGTTAQVVMTYDSKGNQLTLNDPDAGLTTYTYNGLNEILTQTDAKGNIHTMTYDALGRMLTKTGNNGEGLISYTYDNKTKGIGMLGTVNGLGITQDYAYDDYSRLLSQSENINGTNYVTSMLYDNLNRVTKTTYPSGFATTSEYNTNGYLNKINRASDNSLIWQCNSVSERGQVKTAAQGNGGSVSKTYSNLGYLQNISAMEKNGGGTPVSVINDGYSFNPITGNLNTRSKNLPGPIFTEAFTYDNLDRLTNVSLNGSATLTSGYDGSGNITYKTDVGNYGYNATQKPHAVTVIGSPTSNIPVLQQNITYNTFLKPATIAEGTYNLTYNYGPDYERKKSVLQNNGTTQQTIIYSGNYEKITLGANTYEVHYINSPDGLIAINVRTNGTDGLYYLLTDHLGSITSIYDAYGTKVFEQSFDAWGRPRNPANWTYTASGLTQPAWLIRGYTGHEYLPQFGLINMNGRIYDPLIARVLSPDNYVQGADATQAYNRYSYVHNNPLKFTDPDGQWVQYVFGAIAGGVGGYQIGKANGATGWDMAGYIFGGAAVGAVSAGFASGIATAGFAGANTSAIAAGSFSSGVGFNILSGGKAQMSINLGAAQYDLNTNEFKSFSKENTILENVGYGLGAWGNISDVYGLSMGGNSGEVDLATKGHSSWVEKGTNKTIFSVGTNDYQGPFKKSELSFNWDNYVGKGASIESVRGISIDKLRQYNLNLMANFKAKYNLITNNCSIYASKALLSAGGFVIPQPFPMLLRAQILMRNNSYYSYMFH